VFGQLFSVLMGRKHKPRARNDRWHANRIWHLPLRKARKHHGLRPPDPPKSCDPRVRCLNIINRLYQDSLRSYQSEVAEIPARKVVPLEPMAYACAPHISPISRSWRTPDRCGKPEPQVRIWAKILHFCCKLFVYLLFASLVVSACSLPLAVGMKPSESSTQLANPDALADKFSHGINAYLPDGVKFKVDPSEYWKDPETKLTHHKLAELFGICCIPTLPHD
jgi:hypothetical protein